MSAGTYRIPPRARALLRAAVLTAEHPATLLSDRHGRLFLARRMANLVRRGADHAALPQPPAARPSSTVDRRTNDSGKARPTASQSELGTRRPGSSGAGAVRGGLDSVLAGGGAEAAGAVARDVDEDAIARWCAA